MIYGVVWKALALNEPWNLRMTMMTMMIAVVVVVSFGSVAKYMQINDFSCNIFLINLGNIKTSLIEVRWLVSSEWLFVFNLKETV